MISHRYEITTSKALKELLCPLVGVLLISGALIGLTSWNLLPHPLPNRTIDETILTHQLIASKNASGANILLVGDSSCLMDIRADELERTLPRIKIINLGALSYLGLDYFGRFAASYIKANPQTVKTVVLVISPEMFKDVQVPGRFQNFLNQIGYAEAESSTFLSRIDCLELFRQRVLPRILPAPLPGSYGSFYSFNRTLDRFMARHNGSAIDPGDYMAKGRIFQQQFHLSPQLRGPAERFKRSLPSGIHLYVALSPVPKSSVVGEYPSEYREILSDLSEWLQADGVLPLPATMDDVFFATATHLNRSGQAQFTRKVGMAIEETRRLK